MKVTWLINRFPNRCVCSVLHSEKTTHLFGDCQGLDAEKKSTERV